MTVPKLNLTEKERLALRALNSALLQCVRTGALQKLEGFCSVDTVDDFVQGLESMAMADQVELRKLEK